jgi:hypothetical protein
MFYLRIAVQFATGALISVMSFLLTSRHHNVYPYTMRPWSLETWKAGGYLLIALIAEAAVVVCLGVSLWWLLIMVPTILLEGMWASLILDAEEMDDDPRCQPSWAQQPVP